MLRELMMKSQCPGALIGPHAGHHTCRRTTVWDGSSSLPGSPTPRPGSGPRCWTSRRTGYRSKKDRMGTRRMLGSEASRRVIERMRETGETLEKKETKQRKLEREGREGNRRQASVVVERQQDRHRDRGG